MSGYGNIQIQIPEGLTARQGEMYGFSGLRYDVPERALEFSEATDLTDVMFDGEDLMKSCGWVAFGGAPPVTANITCLLEYFDGTNRLPARIFTTGLGPTYALEAEVDATYSTGVGAAGSDITDLGIASAVSMYSSLIATAGGRPVIWDGAAANFSYLSSDAAFTARIIAPFGTRIIAMHCDGDYQKIRWNKTGDLSATGWSGTGSGELFAADVRSDAVDMILGGSQVSDNIFAMFRQRSIWRLFHTGNSNQAIGCLPWISGVGAATQLSIINVGRHVAFLGSDLMPYLLGVGGDLIPVGAPIEKQIKANTTTSVIYATAASGFDAINGEWYLRIDEDVWVFDVKYFYKTQQLRWRRFATNDQALIFGSVGAPDPDSGLDLRTKMVVTDGSVCYNLSETSVTKDGDDFTGVWLSRPLNRTNLATLTMLRLAYRAPVSTTITLKTTTDGGATSAKTRVVTLAATGNKTEIVNVGNIDTTGQDVRFQIEFDTTAEVRLQGYLPVLVERGQYEYKN